eukprot:scaffold17516_cov77-Attheya_sp.AAC.1
MYCLYECPTAKQTCPNILLIISGHWSIRPKWMTANIHFPPQYLFYREARRNAPRTGCVHSGTKQHYFSIGFFNSSISRPVLRIIILTITSLSTMASDSNAHAMAAAANHVGIQCPLL